MPAMLVSAGASLLGGILGGNSAKKAAQASAQAQLEAARIAAEAQKFRPVGVTSRFGSSNFKMNDKGYLESAGYNLAPDVASARDQLLSQAFGQGMGFGQQGLDQGQSLFNLGQQFLPQSTQYQADPNATAYANRLRGLSEQVLPQSYDTQAAAQQYMQQQQALLQPSRDQARAGLNQNLFNTGRGGLAVAQGGMMGAANPEQQAYYNAIAQQDATLAANAQQQARGNLAEDIRLGTGLGNTALSTGTAADTDAYNRMLKNIDVGSGLFTGGLNLASGGYAPFKTQFGLSNTLEQTGQNTLDLGAQLGGRAASAGANVGNTLLQGGTNAARTMQQATGYSPFGSALQGLAGNSNFTNSMANWMGGGAQASFSQTGLGSSGFGSGLAYGNQDLGAYL
jgi:hypothetical protein